MTRAQIHPEMNPSHMADMLKAIDDDRYRVVSVPEAAIVGIFNVVHSTPESLRVPIFEGLPAGYFVNGCIYDLMSRSLLFQVYHPSFDAVDVGEQGKVDGGVLKMRLVRLKD